MYTALETSRHTFMLQYSHYMFTEAILCNIFISCIIQFYTVIRYESVCGQIFICNAFAAACIVRLHSQQIWSCSEKCSSSRSFSKQHFCWVPFKRICRPLWQEKLRQAKPFGHCSSCHAVRADEMRKQLTIQHGVIQWVPLCLLLIDASSATQPCRVSFSACLGLDLIHPVPYTLALDPWGWVMRAIGWALPLWHGTPRQGHKSYILSSLLLFAVNVEST